jgi:hypothetical protein
MKILEETKIFDRRSDKSKKPYWNPVRRVGHVRGPKSDNLICKNLERRSNFEGMIVKEILI